ncbi:conserved hypothetical protein [Trichinella spiralis]|uniref:hypothetical protein n=1 Tax=Trichinella spiralis TaxID=6334 RepID=UPI0001EFBD42|nr:conserved hypothetical protein [Trichinella spiralis]
MGENGEKLFRRFGRLGDRNGNGWESNFRKKETDARIGAPDVDGTTNHTTVVRDALVECGVFVGDDLVPGIRDLSSNGLPAGAGSTQHPVVFGEVVVGAVLDEHVLQKVHHARRGTSLVFVFRCQCDRLFGRHHLPPLSVNNCSSATVFVVFVHCQRAVLHRQLQRRGKSVEFFHLLGCVQCSHQCILDDQFWPVAPVVCDHNDHAIDGASDICTFGIAIAASEEFHPNSMSNDQHAVFHWTLFDQSSIDQLLIFSM